jgi:hypothetical protein
MQETPLVAVKFCILMELKRIHQIIDKFTDPDDRSEVIAHYVSTAREILLDESEIKHSKIELLCDLKDYGGYNELLNEVLDHKVLQTQALVLDLVSTDYTAECQSIYKTEKWMKELVKDAREAFDLESPDERAMFEMYNQKLLGTFCGIFLSEAAPLGSGGNQLLLNFTYYKKFVVGRVECDFGGFFKKVRSAFKEENYMSDEELEQILREVAVWNK